MRLRNGAFVLVTLAVVIGGLALLAVANTNRLVQWQFDRNVGQLLADQEVTETGFEVIFCGTGSPQYQASRAQPCVGIVAGGHFLLFDTGLNTADQISALRLPFRHLNTVFLTHLHSDHMSGLGETLQASWLLGRQNVVDVVGPPGTEEVMEGFHRVYAEDIAERHRVVGAEFLNTDFGLGNGRDVQVDGDEAETAFDRDGVVVRAFRVDHPDWDYAYGYRIEFGGKAVVISGDTRYTPAIGRHARGADILIHEALNLELMAALARTLEAHGAGIDPVRLARIEAVHTPTEMVAQAAQEAGVNTLVVTHLIPTIPANGIAERLFTRGMDDNFDGEIIVARDGMRITLVE